MAYFAGSLIYRTTVKLQKRVFLLPGHAHGHDFISRVKRNSGTVFHVKGRDYSSSFPVKRTSKESSKDEGNGATSLPGRFWENGPELNVKGIDFSRSFLDVKSKNHAPSCAPNEFLELEEDVEVDVMFLNDESEDSSVRRRRTPLTHSWRDVEKSAIGLLASRAYTAVELKKKLQAKRFQLEIIDAMITDLQKRGLMNDCLYAETYAQSKWSTSSWGPQRIRQELFKKGVSKLDVEKAIKLVFRNGEGSGDDNSGIAMSKISLDQLYLQVSKQWQRSHGVPQETRQTRIVRWLQYRGYNWSVIKYVLKKLETVDPS